MSNYAAIFFCSLEVLYVYSRFFVRMESTPNVTHPVERRNLVIFFDSINVSRIFSFT